MTPQPHPFAEAVTLATQFYDDGELARWLYLPQPLCGGSTPIQLLATGRSALLLQVMQALDDGVYI